MDRLFFALAITLIGFGLIISAYAFGTSVSCLCVEGSVCNCPDPFAVLKGISLFPIVAGIAIMSVLGWKQFMKREQEAA